MTDTKPPPKKTDSADSATKRIEKARRMVKDAMKAMTLLRARIISLRREADELEKELNAMVEGLGLAIPPVVVEPTQYPVMTKEEHLRASEGATRPVFATVDGRKVGIYPCQLSEDRPDKYNTDLNGRRVAAVEAPEVNKFEIKLDPKDKLKPKFFPVGAPPGADPVGIPGIPIVDPAPLRELADEISEDDDLRDAPMSVVLAECSGTLLSRFLNDCEYAQIETIGQLAAWLQAKPGRVLADLLLQRGDAEIFREAIWSWSSRWDFKNLTSDGLPVEWFDHPPEPIEDEIARRRETTPVTKPKHRRESKREVITLERIHEIAAEPLDDESPPEPSPKRSKAPALPTELQLKLREALDPTWKNWDEFRRLGIDDKTLLAAIRVRFEELPKEKRGRHWSCAGGDDPRFWPTASGYKGGTRNALRGSKLVDATRDVMELTKP